MDKAQALEAHAADDGSAEVVAEACAREMPGHSSHGVFTDRPETLTNDFFVNLLDNA